MDNQAVWQRALLPAALLGLLGGTASTTSAATAVHQSSRLRRAFERLERAMDEWCAEAKLAA